MPVVGSELNRLAMIQLEGLEVGKVGCPRSFFCSMGKQKVLIVCTGNVARSQMAEGLLRHEAGDRFEVFSAGLHPSYVRPHAIQVMQEIGIDISGHRSKSVDEFAGKEMDYVITVCDHAAQHCPAVPAKNRRIHWSIEDPLAPGGEEAQLAMFRRVRDDLRRRLRDFAELS